MRFLHYLATLVFEEEAVRFWRRAMVVRMVVEVVVAGESLKKKEEVEGEFRNCGDEIQKPHGPLQPGTSHS
ncbi:hypothetical protein AHAS_Ahas05G0074200 [Arachis hypogaea]